MKNTLLTLIIKLILAFVAAWFSFSFIGGNTLGWSLLTAAVTAIISYFIIDLIVLPSLGNIAASILDGILAALIAFLISLLAGGVEVNNQMVDVFRTNLLTLAFYAIIIAIMEYFLHSYLLQTGVLPAKKDYYK